MAQIRDWQNPTVTAVADPGVAAHSIHAYFTTCPESPDGSALLYLHSTQPAGEHGDLVLQQRHSGERRTVAAGLHLEDAHRVACQQWADGGRAIVWHCHVDGRWQVMAADADGTHVRILATDRQLGFGAPGQPEVPIYGPHWDPAASRDLELVHSRSGARRTVLSQARLRQLAGPWLDATFGPDAPVSVFFPVLSPDGRRVYFKVACPTGHPGDGAPWKGAVSKRECLCVYDLSADRLLWRHDFWGHPNWSADSRHIVNVPNVIIDADDGQVTPLPGVPYFPMSHPSWHPSGAFYVTDTQLTRFGMGPYWWGLMAVRRDGAHYLRLHRWYAEGGAASWRIPHPHPVFSHDGRRLYFNRNDGPWTRLTVLTPRG